MALRVNNSRSIVADRHFDHLCLPPRVNLDAAALPRILHRIVRIIENIRKTCCSCCESPSAAVSVSSKSSTPQRHGWRNHNSAV